MLADATAEEAPAQTFRYGSAEAYDTDISKLEAQISAWKGDSAVDMSYSTNGNAVKTAHTDDIAKAKDQIESLNAEKLRLQQKKKIESYSNLSASADYKKNSGYVGGADKFFSMDYSLINGQKSLADLFTMGDNDAFNRQQAFQQLTEQERKTYNYLYNTGRKNDAGGRVKRYAQIGLRSLSE